MGTKHTPYAYIYLDKEGINSLYSQTVDQVQTELTKTSEKGKSGKLGSELALGALLGFGVEGNTELSVSGSRIELAKFSLTSEQKLVRLLEYLETFEGEKFFSNLIAATHGSSGSSESVFINVKEEFDVPQFFPGRDGVAAANDVQSVLFEIGKPRVIMSASLKKFPRAHDAKLGYVGHDAILFRENQGQDVPLNVFGQLIKLKDSYQIKPYAIWI